MIIRAQYKLPFSHLKQFWAGTHQADILHADYLPPQTFGHLNAGWRALLADRQLGDTLWYFEIPGYTPDPEHTPQRHQWSVPQGAKRGYALVQSGKVRAEFIFEWD